MKVEVSKPFWGNVAQWSENPSVRVAGALWIALLPLIFSLVKSIFPEHNRLLWPITFDRMIEGATRLRFCLIFQNYFNKMISLPNATILAVCSIFVERLEKQIATPNIPNTLNDRVVTASPKKTLADVIGHEEAKVAIRTFIEIIKEPARAKEYGIENPGDLLLCGPPGVGKTELARAAAGEARCLILEKPATDFIEVFMGSGPQNIRELFKKAREKYAKYKRPIIMFIDELDAFGSRKSGAIHVNDEKTRTILALTAHMSNPENHGKIFYIGATNHEGDIDPAITRSGRFGNAVLCTLPNQDEREKILALYLRGKPQQQAINLREIAQNSVDFSGADLKEVVDRSVRIAFTARRNVTLEDLQNSHRAILEKKTKAVQRAARGR